MQRNANMLKSCVFADFVGFFAKIQSPVYPPERTLSLRRNFVIHYASSAYKVISGRKKYSTSASSPPDNTCKTFL